jgi:hypothetical protein
MNEPTLSRLEAEFCQDGNTSGTTSETEVLTICLENIGPDGDGFWTIKTDGWSVDEATELAEIIDRVRRMGNG